MYVYIYMVLPLRSTLKHFKAHIHIHRHDLRPHGRPWTKIKIENKTKKKNKHLGPHGRPSTKTKKIKPTPPPKKKKQQIQKENIYLL